MLQKLEVMIEEQKDLEQELKEKKLECLEKIKDETFLVEKLESKRRKMLKPKKLVPLQILAECHNE